MKDHHPSLAEQRLITHKRQMRKLLLSISPAVLVAVGIIAWRLA